MSTTTRRCCSAVQVVVVDEIGSPAEAAAVRGIAQRGVAMVGTAHGTDLSSLLANPDLNSLVGGIHQVTLGDTEARSVFACCRMCQYRLSAVRLHCLHQIQGARLG